MWLVKIKILDGERYKMVVNSLEDLEGEVGLKRVLEFVPEAGKNRNERMKVSSDSSFWQFHQKGVSGRP